MRSKIWCVVFGLALLLTFSGNGWSGDERYPIMKPDRATFLKWIESYENAPEAFIDEKLMEKGLAASVDLLSHIDYVPSERDQGYCGNCWLWAGTGVMEIAHSVQEGVKDRLSIQYVDSCRSESFACCGGWLEYVSDYYAGTGKAIPWSNTNASYQDTSTLCSYLSSNVSCGSISTSPSYPVSSISYTKITTQGVSQATAIANIKNVLNQNKGVWFAFFLSNGSDWDVFYDFWSNNSESDVFNFDYSCGHTWDDMEGGGHAVLIVGYSDDDPGNSYWIVLNSWGAETGRPNGLFRVDMDMSYDCTFYDNGNYDSHYFQTLDVEFTEGTITTTTIGPVSTTTTVPETTTTTSISPDSMPNLMPCTLYGWSYPVVPSSQQGTHTYDPATDILYPSPQKTYIDIALCNENNGDATETFTVVLYVDEIEVFNEETENVLDGKSYKTWLDEQFSFSEGEHTLKLIVDFNNDIDEADENDNTFEINFTWGAEWSGLYSEMFGVDYIRDVHLLRNVRDEILITNKMGKVYVDLLYKNSSEIAALLSKDKALRVHTADVVERLIPELAALLNGEEVVISSQMTTAIEALLDEFEVRASPGVRTAVKKLKKDIRRGRMFDQLGIKTE